MRETIFQQHWWLDAVAPGRWHEARVTDSDGVVARLPYVTATRFGLRTIGQPPLCMTLGPWLRSSGTRGHRRHHCQTEWVRELVAQLPPFDLFRQKLAPEFPTWLPFHWLDFEQTTRYTYRFERLDDLPALRANFKPSLRSDLNRASRRLQVVELTDIDTFYRTCEFSLKAMKAQRRALAALPITARQFERLHAACLARQQGVILAAVDETAYVHAVDFYVWDEHVMYGLLSGRNDHAMSGAAALLIWHAMQRAAQLGVTYDFGGSMMPSIAAFFQGFGPEPTPYSQITKTTWRHRSVQHIKNVIRTPTRLFGSRS